MGHKRLRSSAGFKRSRDPLLDAMALLGPQVPPLALRPANPPGPLWNTASHYTKAQDAFHAAFIKLLFYLWLWLAFLLSIGESAKAHDWGAAGNNLPTAR